MLSEPRAYFRLRIYGQALASFAGFFPLCWQCKRGVKGRGRGCGMATWDHIQQINITYRKEEGEGGPERRKRPYRRGGNLVSPANVLWVSREARL